jgi:hypothetical protein
MVRDESAQQTSRNDDSGWKMEVTERDHVRTILQSKHTARVITSADRKIIRAICESAIASNAPPERLLIQFKRSLFELADASGIQDGPERSELIERMVSVCIEEYYTIPKRDGNGPGR